MKILDFLQMFCLIIFIILACIWAMDNILVWKYDLRSAAYPCDICIESNPYIAKCLENSNKYQIDPLTGIRMPELKLNVSVKL